MERDSTMQRLRVADEKPVHASSKKIDTKSIFSVLRKYNQIENEK